MDPSRREALAQGSTKNGHGDIAMQEALDGRKTRRCDFCLRHEEDLLDIQPGLEMGNGTNA
jgi:hypothetical protein